jgi:hypothetical protein
LWSLKCSGTKIEIKVIENIVYVKFSGSSCDKKIKNDYCTDCSNKKKTLLTARVDVCWIWRVKCVEEGNFSACPFACETKQMCGTEL